MLFRSINFLILFFLAVNRTRVFLLMLPGIVVQYFLIVSSHNTLYDVIRADIFAGIITLGLLILYFVKTGNEKRINEN